MANFYSNLINNISGTSLMIKSALLSSFLFLITKITLNENIPLFNLIFIRSLFVLIFFFKIKNFSLKDFKDSMKKNIFDFIGTFSLFYVIDKYDLAMIIAFLTPLPIINTIRSVFVMKEKTRYSKYYLCFFLSFYLFSIINFYSLYKQEIFLPIIITLFVSIMWSFCDFIIKNNLMKINPKNSGVYLSLYFLLFSFPFLEYSNISYYSIKSLFLILILSLLSYYIQLLMFKSFKKMNFLNLQIFEIMKVVILTFLAIIFLSEKQRFVLLHLAFVPILMFFLLILKDVYEETIIYRKKLQKIRLNKKEIGIECLHEIKTTISIINFSIHKLYSSSQEYETIDVIEKNLGIITNKVNYLFDRYESKDPVVTLNKQTFILNDLVNKVINNIIKNDSLEILIYSKAKIVVNMDIDKIETIFKNLIENGIKYNDKEKKVIKIFYIKKNNILFIKVKDNGIGMSNIKLNENLSNNATFNNNNEICNQGLKIIRKIVELYNGKIYTYSKVGLYTSVNIKLNLEHGKSISN